MNDFLWPAAAETITNEEDLHSPLSSPAFSTDSGDMQEKLQSRVKNTENYDKYKYNQEKTFLEQNT